MHRAPRRWLEDFAQDLGLTYKNLVDGLQDSVDYGTDITFNYNTPDAAYDAGNIKRMWECWEQVTGNKVPQGKEQDSPFSCAC